MHKEVSELKSLIKEDTKNNIISITEQGKNEIINELKKGFQDQNDKLMLGISEAFKEGGEELKKVLQDLSKELDNLKTNQEGSLY